MRLLLVALLALLCLPATAAAAPWAEAPFHPLRGDRTAHCMTATAADRVAVLAETGAGAETIELLRVTADGALQADGSLRLDGNGACPSVAAASSGAAVVAAASGFDRESVVIASREPGAGFAAPLRIGVPPSLDASGVVTAVAPSGAAVVAWTESIAGEITGRVRAVRRAAGGSFAAPETLPRNRVHDGQLVAGVDDAGRATVAWALSDKDGQPGSDAVEAVTAAPGERFPAPQRLTQGVSTFPEPALAVAPDGGVLLAHGGHRGLRVFERAPGDVLMTPVAVYPRVPERRDPVVALAPGGGALVAWLRDDDVPNESGLATIEVAFRAPGSAFQPAHLLERTTPGATGWAGVAPLPSFRASSLDAAVGSDGGAVLTWDEPRSFGLDEVTLAALAGGSVSGRWEGARLLGGPGRSAGGPVALASPAAALWIDNAIESYLQPEAPGSGRVHIAVPGVVERDPEPPSLTLEAEPQRIRIDQPVIVTARCSAACDLRAFGDADGSSRGFDAAELDGPGARAITLFDQRGLVPRGGAPLRVTVHATAPGGSRLSAARIDVPVRPAFIPPPRRPRDIRARRRGDDVVVTWRTARPAREERFSVQATRGRDGSYVRGQELPGRGMSRFRVVLEGARRATWIELKWWAIEPRPRGGRTFVRVGSA